MASMLDVEHLDAILDELDVSIFRVHASQGNATSSQNELCCLLMCVESVRDFMQAMVSDLDYCRLAHTIFGGDAKRMERLRLALQSSAQVHMEADDQRWSSCLEACHCLVKILEEIDRVQTPERVSGVSGTLGHGAKSVTSTNTLGKLTTSLESSSTGSNPSDADAEDIPCCFTDSSTISSEEDSNNITGKRNASQDPCYARTSFNQTSKSVSTDSGHAAAGQARIARLAAASAATSMAIGAVTLQDQTMQIFDEKRVASTTSPTHELRVQVERAFHLGVPEYRLGDLSMAVLLSGGRERLESVYAELELDGFRVRTETSATDTRRRSACFTCERYLLPFAGKPVLIVRVRDKRHLQAVIRGDPLVGEGTLQLDSDIFDGRPRSTQVQLKRAGVPSGVLALRYQALQSMETLDGNMEAMILGLPTAEQGSELDHDLQSGSGSWVIAYRHAGARRRLAFRLLFASGIVTRMELVDDQTEVSSEHIDECVQIADAMLTYKSCDTWLRSPANAKACFEQLFTESYHRRLNALGA